MTRRGLRVLISNEGEDTGGVAIAIQRAFERYAPHYDVRAMRGLNNYIDYPENYSWNYELFRDLWAWADVVHTMENIHNLIRLYNPPGKPIVLHHHGEIFRHNWPELDRISQDNNLIQLGSTIDLSSYSKKVRWLPNPIDVPFMQAIRHQYRPPVGREEIRFTHSPTAHRAAKGTDQYVAAVHRMGADLVLIQNESWIEALRLKATGDVHLDQLIHAYGLSGLEAMAMGIPVVSSAYPEVQEGVERKVGYLPYYAIHGTVEETLRAICDPKVQAEAAAKGTQYINDHHAQDKVVAKLKRVYAEAMERYDPNEGPWSV